MVYSNGLKYACEACIKGHRSSSCTHTDRALFEIKKKGRPVTQCEHCRQLRKTKQVHVKCSCEGSADDEKKETLGKAKRKMPTSATFPEGLKSASSSPSPAPQQKPKASSSSNCTSGHCTCATPVTKKSHRSRLRAPSSDVSSGPVTPPPIPSFDSYCKEKSQPVREQPQIQHSETYQAFPSDGLARPLTPHIGSYEGYASGSTPLTIASTFTWPSGIGVGMCSCGVTCECPGCYEHSDLSTALLSSESCPYACTSCNNCNGFGFVTAAPPPLPSHDSTWEINNDLQTFGSWPIPTPTMASIPAASSSVSTMSSCCGGSCQCAAQALACECDIGCCGCCFGCSCSDESSPTSGDCEDDVRDRLGFAVSGERGSCCSEGQTKRQRNGEDEVRRKKPKVEDHRGSGYPHEGSPTTTQFRTRMSDPNGGSGVQKRQPSDSDRQIGITEDAFRFGYLHGSGNGIGSGSGSDGGHWVPEPGGVPGF